MTYTLGTASKATGVSKSTIYRAIKAGRISASRTDPAADYAIDPAELHRVFPPISATDEMPNAASVKRHATPVEQPDTTALDVQIAALDVQIVALRQVNELLANQLAETRHDRDH